jgi:hypothetical protein
VREKKVLSKEGTRSVRPRARRMEKKSLSEMFRRAREREEKKTRPFEGGRPNRAEIWSGGSRARTKG